MAYRKQMTRLKVPYLVADNAPGRALYASLGFSRELYRYHHRRKAISA
jgi:hypothetical protein